MASITTAMTGLFREQILQGIHNLQGTLTISGTTTLGSKNITAMANVTDVSPGMLVADTDGDIPASTYTSKLNTTSSIGMDTAATGGHAGQNITFKGDSVAFALIKNGYSGTYGAANTNYSELGADEVTGPGYTAGGFVWAAGAMITPTHTGTQAYTQPSTNPSWTGATFATQGGMLYNVSKLGYAICIESFGGLQAVTSGTLTLLLPTNGAGTSLLQVN